MEGQVPEMNFEGLAPAARRRIEEFSRRHGISLDEATERVVIEAVAMGGITLAGRKKAKVTPIKPAEVGPQ